MMNDKAAAAVVSEEQVERVAKGIANAMRNHIDDSHAYWQFMGDELKETYRSMAQAALGVGGWRPISEAPKDKQFFAADMHFDIGIAYWHEKNPHWGIPDRYEWVTSGWDDSPPPVYYLPSPPPASEEG